LFDFNLILTCDIFDMGFVGDIDVLLKEDIISWQEFVFSLPEETPLSTELLSFGLDCNFDGEILGVD